MTNQDFQKILDDLLRGITPELTKMVDGVTYTRVFLPENRLILLGGSHIAQPLCAIAAMLDFAVTVDTTRADMGQAVMEGVAFAIRDSVPALQWLQLCGDLLLHESGVLDCRPCQRLPVFWRCHTDDSM